VKFAPAGTASQVSTILPPREPITSLENAANLDPPAKAVAAKIRSWLKPGPVKDAVSGTWLGHPLHPLLTDLVIGSLVSANLVDLIAPRSGAKAAERLIAVGIAAAVPTALTGASDWADTELSDETVRRVGAVHAGTNAAAQLIYLASLQARRRGHGARGRLLALIGAGVLGAGGYLGAHLSYVRGVGVNQTVFDEGSPDWTDAVASADLPDGRPHGANAGDTPVLVVRQGERVHAIHDRCSHRGCLLSDGELDGTVITCPCHGSQFDVRDGALVRGPAVVGQPAFQTRENNGRIEVRRAGEKT
jgi:nitrite reductase/ring-hydroxylating ferredoxin subunit/uncharacterized membrane protein